MRKTIIFVFTLAVLLAVQTYAVSLTMTCYTCDVTSCASRYCIGLVGSDGYKEVTCVAQGSTCDTTMNTTVEVANCTRDYKNDVCTSGACFLLADKPIARFLDATCETPAYRNTTCDACVASPCNNVAAPRCIVVQTGPVNGVANPSDQQCVADCGTKTVKSIAQACPNGRDTLGTMKSCCYTFLGSAAPVCSSQATYLGSSNFQKWVTKPSTLFEHNIVSVMIVALLLCLGIFVA